MKPTRCCAPAAKGRCSNAPAPYGQSRYIGAVEIAACNHPKHQAALRSLPDFQRRAGVCGADDCGKAAESGLCPEHRQLYRRHGIDTRALLAQEAPMPTTPEAQTPPVTPYDVLDATAKVWFAMPQEERDACLVAISVATISTGESAPMPPAEPQEAADGGATPSPEAVEAFLLTAKPAPADDGEPSEGDVDDAPLFVGSTDSAPMPPMSPDLAALTTDPMQQRREAVVARLLALGAEEQPGRHPTARVFALKYEAYIVPDVSYSAKDMDAAMQSVERACDRLELFMAGRWSQKHTAPVQPTAPGPTLAEVQAQLERERERADRAELDAVQERERADEAKAELAAIAALLDPEDAPAYDSDDKPIPLPTRVQTALGVQESNQIRHLRAEKDALWEIINDAEWIVHHCGSYGSTASLADRVLRLLPVERQRAILELKRSEAYIEVARINARFLNPPPPGRLEEYEAAVAALDARIAALDAEKVQE